MKQMKNSLHYTAYHTQNASRLVARIKALSVLSAFYGRLLKRAIRKVTEGAEDLGKLCKTSCGKLALWFLLACKAQTAVIAAAIARISPQATKIHRCPQRRRFCRASQISKAGLPAPARAAAGWLGWVSKSRWRNNPASGVFDENHFNLYFRHKFYKYEFFMNFMLPKCKLFARAAAACLP